MIRQEGRTKEGHLECVCLCVMFVALTSKSSFFFASPSQKAKLSSLPSTKRSRVSLKRQSMENSRWPIRDPTSKER